MTWQRQLFMSDLDVWGDGGVRQAPARTRRDSPVVRHGRYVNVIVSDTMSVSLVTATIKVNVISELISF